MERSPPFRKRDLVRAVRALEDAGLAIGRVEIENDGKLVIVPAGAVGGTRPGAASPPHEVGSPK